MPGQFGNTQVTVKNEVLSYDAENGILVLKGAVPGHKGARGLVRIVK
jgi:large subunit ribosomal protein L3